MLPAPSSERWKPLRAGLVDLFYYDAEEFWFHDGRLLLRGNNGAADYRRAVDEALFGLGEHRYEALVNLLIQLRQPQLSKRPDEKLLSRALTEALPPISPGLVTTVAEAFRGLDEERDALRDLQ